MKPLHDKHFTLPAAALIPLLHDTRERTLALFEDLDAAQWEVPYLDIVNPFRWELGHVAFFDTFQIPVDSFQKASGDSRMWIRKQNLYDSSTSPTNQRQHDEVYQTPRFKSPDPHPYRHARLAASRCLRENDANRPGVSDIADLSLSTSFDGKPPVGNAV
jgi:hypothetical protein